MVSSLPAGSHSAPAAAFLAGRVCRGFLYHVLIIVYSSYEFIEMNDELSRSFEVVNDYELLLSAAHVNPHSNQKVPYFACAGLAVFRLWIGRRLALPEQAGHEDRLHQITSQNPIYSNAITWQIFDFRIEATIYGKHQV